MSIYKETIARYGNLGVSPAVLRGVSGVNVDKGIKKYDYRGDTHQHNFSNISAAPVGSFTTTDLKAILTATSLDMVKLNSTNKLELNWRKMVHGGAFAGGGTGMQAIFSEGVMLPLSLNCSQGEPCSLSVQVIGSSADGTNPLSISKTATTPSEIVQDRAYTIAAMKFGGSETIPVEAMAIDFGIGTEIRSSDGVMYPAKVYKSSMNTVINITSYDLARFFDFSDGAIDITDDVIIYFARLKEGGSRYANGDTEHIKMTIKGHIMSTGPLSENVSIQIIPVWDGTNSLFSFNTGSAIT